MSTNSKSDDAEPAGNDATGSFNAAISSNEDADSRATNVTVADADIATENTATIENDDVESRVDEIATSYDAG